MRGSIACCVDLTNRGLSFRPHRERSSRGSSAALRGSDLPGVPPWRAAGRERSSRGQGAGAPAVAQRPSALPPCTVTWELSREFFSVGAGCAGRPVRRRLLARVPRLCGGAEHRRDLRRARPAPGGRRRRLPPGWAALRSGLARDDAPGALTPRRAAAQARTRRAACCSRRVASARSAAPRSWDGRVRLFDSKQAKPLASLKYHTQVSHDTSLWALPSGVSGWERVELSLSVVPPAPQAATAVAFLGPEDGGIATAGRDGGIALWKMYGTAASSNAAKGLAPPVTDIVGCLSPGGGKLQSTDDEHEHS